MPSQARLTLDANKDDLDRLWELHEKEAGPERGRKYNVDVLNRAAVVLVCAVWEAYCEDVIKEAITHMVNDCGDIANLPKVLKTVVADQIKSDKNDQAAWRLAGDGWKSELQTNASVAIKLLTGSWHSPKTSQVKDLFHKALGISDVTSAWFWQKNPVASTKKKLDGFVTLRGQIAHRSKTTQTVRKDDGTKFYDLVCRLADKIDTQVHDVLKAATGKQYW